MGRFAGLFKGAERKASLGGCLLPLGTGEPTPETDAVAAGGRRAMKVLLRMLEGGKRAERGAARRIMLSRSSEEDRALFTERLVDEIERERGWRG